MFTCPHCRRRLVRTRGENAVFWACPACKGRAVGLAVLRRTVLREPVIRLWQLVCQKKGTPGRPCPSCERPMIEVGVSAGRSELRLDVCRPCQFVWFDPTEFEQMPARPAEPVEKDKLSPEARERLAILQVQQMAEKARGGDFGTDAPDEWWKCLPALLGMPVEHETSALRRVPWVTWGLAAVVTVLSVSAFFDLANVLHRYGLIPARAGRYGGLTLLTAFFLHGGIFHLVGNMYFLLTFGDNVEDFLGKWRYVGLLLFATVAGAVAHIAMDPASEIPCIGASGGISGLIVFYALAFPRARLGFLIRYWMYFRWIRIPAYAALILWILFQLVGAWMQASGAASVSFAAHLGGAAVGLGAWLIWRKG